MALKIDDLTLSQAKELARLVGASSPAATVQTLHQMLGKVCIVRTASAGVWFGTLAEKAGAEVILTNARRMWRWWAAESISLSAVALHGVKREKSKIAEAVPSVWLEAIELIPCSVKAEESIGGADVAEAE